MHNTFDDYRGKNWGLVTLPQWLNRLKRPASILEVGCGNGKLCKLLSDLGYDVTGLDLVPGSYDRDGYNFVKHDITLSYLPFKDNEFDYCLSFDVLEHLPTKWVEQSIWDMFRVANSIVVSVACYGNEPLHLTVRPPEWWVEKFNRLCLGNGIKTFHIFNAPENSHQKLLFYGTSK
jgi:SAM-dependent methyltransferase